MPWFISDQSDAALVRETLAGQAEAFNILVRRWERKVYGYLAHLTGRTDDALDLCQDVFLSAYRHLRRLRDPARFRPWLFQIAHNTAYSHLRRPRPTEDEAETNSAPDRLSVETRLDDGSVWEPRELRALMEQGLGQLSVEQREAIVLKIFDGLKFSEIAEVQGCPVSTVKTRLYTGFDELRLILQRSPDVGVSTKLKS